MRKPRDIDAAIAERLFGWKWFKKSVSKLDGSTVELSAIFGPEEEWNRVNYHPASWSPSDSSAERFEDWDRLCYKPGKDRRERSYEGLPRFSSDMEWAMKAVDALASRGFLVNIRSRTYGDRSVKYDVQIWAPGQLEMLVDGRTSLPMAHGISDMVLDALEREEEENAAGKADPVG
jgi:hypothetical protein